MAAPALLSLPDLLAMSVYARETGSPLMAPHLVAVALQAGDEAKASLRQTADAIQRLSCPVIAVAPEAHPLASAFDARVDSADELRLLAHNIAQSPLAASVLVQVLRHTEGMALAPALWVESLAYAT
ncbi:MAG: enoyl-CoA hydratase/isomerase family protein, partial [Polaromonas sp.]|nr:enoyl-CoA hydratase/isomerase family protein [Polaromonas sp.]